MKKQRIYQGINIINGFLAFLFWMMVSCIAVRLFEAALLGHYQGDFHKQFSLCVKGLCYDVLLCAKWAVVLLPIYLLCYRFSEKVALWVFRIMGTIMLLVSNAMIMYYVPAGIPLDRVFFTYSVEQLVYIAHSTGAFVWWGYVLLLLIPALFFVVSRIRIRLEWPGLVIWLVLAFVGLFLPRFSDRMYDNREEMHTVCNKQEYFWNSVLRSNKSFNRLTLGDLNIQRIEEFQAHFPEDEFVDPYYPFCHIDQSPDVLSEFFDLDPQRKPDLVFVITEGLGREFSGYNSYLPSATPFLDSLADQGLSWVNCMSTSQRTFAVLPSLFGSLPFGKNGFMQSATIPRFHSMINVLKDNGYRTSFFYGGWLCFDDMCYFLKSAGIEHYLPDHNDYPPELQNNWGLYDHVLFEEGLKQVEAQDSLPRLDIYLTLSTHDPFEYPDKERYIGTYVDALVRRGQQQSIHQNLYEQYASFLYFDRCLRDFFTAYKRLPNYENTIFVITGDHHFNSKADEMEKYHVPLVIWSPRLKESHRFPAMVTHRDVAPSLIAMMKQRCGIQSPEVVCWINQGLDTVSEFRACSFAPMMKGSRKTDMIYRDRFVDDGTVYYFDYQDDVLSIKPITDEGLLHFENEYWAMDDYVMNQDALVLMDEVGQKVLIDMDEPDKQWELDLKYPLRYLDLNLSDTLKSVQIHLDFDIFIPKVENTHAIAVCLSLDRPDMPRDVLNTVPINDKTFQDYGEWTHFTLFQTLRKETHYPDGGRLLGYFSNLGEQKFKINNLRLKVVGDYK